LNVTPSVIFHTAADSTRAKAQKLGVPVAVAMPVQFQPARIIMDALTAGTATKKEFYAWSSTRSHFDLQLTAPATDALFQATMTPVRVGGIFSRCDCPDLLEALKPPPAAPDKGPPPPPPPHVRSAQRVSLTVYESKAGQYLDLGSYYRKLDVQLDGIRPIDVNGPEVLGRVHGEIKIGGDDDQARVRFKAFNARDGATKTVELLADAKWKLETYRHEPAWLKVKLTPDKNQDDPKRTIWRLQVTIPENAPGVRSLEDPDAITLRIVGPPERFVRIPIEGQLGGR